jgi:ribosomal protein L7/L12
MSSGLYFMLGLAVGAALTAVIFMSARRRPPVPRDLAEQVSEETLARARELVAAGKIVHAVKAIRDETGWDLRRSKAVVDGMPRMRKKDDGFGYYGGPS